MRGLTVNAVVRCLLSLWVVGAGMAREGVLALTLETLPNEIALFVGVLGMIFVIPALWAAVFGIFGIPTSWPPLLSEMTLDSTMKRGPLLETILRVIGRVYKYLVFLPFECPPYLSWLPPWIQWLLFRETETLYAPSDGQKANAIVKNEYWIFVNGVATTSEIALSNVHKLHEMFRRPIWLCHNPTDSVLVDLLECATGKLLFFDWLWEPKPRRVLADAVRDALLDAPKKYTRVVLICHSQGTIIASNVITKELWDGSGIDDAQIKKLMKKYLEVYAFANCANQMPDLHLNHLENITNGRDTVAWLGAFFPFKRFWQDTNGRGIEIGGSFVTERHMWGHLLNTHYLPRMQNNKYAASRLHKFRNGGVPLPNVIVPAKRPD
jgi:hypothetical protein